MKLQIKVTVWKKHIIPCRAFVINVIQFRTVFVVVLIISNWFAKIVILWIHLLSNFVVSTSLLASIRNIVTVNNGHELKGDISKCIIINDDFHIFYFNFSILISSLFRGSHWQFKSAALCNGMVPYIRKDVACTNDDLAVALWRMRI